MDKIVMSILVVAILLLAMPVSAEVRSFDFDVMSVKELDTLIDEIKAD